MAIQINEKIAAELSVQLAGKPIAEQFAILLDQLDGKVVFTTSLGQEDQVITDIIYQNNIGIKIATLDTGRLFEESYKTINKTNNHYAKKMDVYFPESGDVEKLITEKGPLSFYESIENRKECCNIRKVKPLQRILKDQLCWVTGLRAAQSDSRKEIRIIEYDHSQNILKFNPLYEWSLQQVIDYLKTHHVPYNILHDKGFVSIGCEPCTRAIGEGEDIRAGRWWWENNSGKECGLHHTEK